MCPKLVLLVPSKALNRSTGAKLKSILRPTDWFTESCKLYFLCAHDFSPAEPAMDIKELKDGVQKLLPALKLSMAVIQMGVAAGRVVTGLPFPMPSNLSGTLDHIKDMQDLLGPYLDVEAHVTEKMDTVLESVDLAKRATLGFTRTESDKLQMAQKLAGPAFRAVAELAKAQGVMTKLNMQRVVNGDGTVAWVKTENVEAWRSAGGVVATALVSARPSDQGSMPPPVTPPPPPRMSPRPATSLAGEIEMEEKAEKEENGVPRAEYERLMREKEALESQLAVTAKSCCSIQ
eukprot:CAMPEP_0118964604 /NCGR_PEP_ID=MMETSP1173-20130426/2264_1 /TAXON_ID=1034831 /ORGANISM="Rhizochromulina marina cf, Strain CCMP1243" /LENGTH=289 /DNA_ID=CAMNT_0006913081 /DNA_START=9 /DNA_END=878 /DNA_ORIENTATION=+